MSMVKCQLSGVSSRSRGKFETLDVEVLGLVSNEFALTKSICDLFGVKTHVDSSPRNLRIDFLSFGEITTNDIYNNKVVYEK